VRLPSQSIIYLRGSGHNLRNGFLPSTVPNAPHQPNCFLSSSRSSFSPFLPVSNDTPRAPDRGLASIINYLPPSLLHLEIVDSDYGWYYAAWYMAGNFSQVKDRETVFVGLYCVNPPEDSCPIGICPNPDIAGTLLRIARKFSLSFFPQMVT